MSIDKDLEVIEQHAEDMKCRDINAIRAKVPKGIGAEFCVCGNELASQGAITGSAVASSALRPNMKDLKSLGECRENT